MLFETSSGYGLFERLESTEIGQELDQVQQACQDLAKFGKLVKLKSFIPFKSSTHALENINDVSEGTKKQTNTNTNTNTNTKTKTTFHYCYLLVLVLVFFFNKL